MMKSEMDLRIELVRICRKLESKGFIAATDGNVSCRLGEDRLLVTPSGRAKGELHPMDFLSVDLQGKPVCCSGKPSSEIRMHVLVYQQRKDVRAVVHAHPPMLTAYTLAGIPFMAEALPEVRVSIGSVPTAPYATPSTEEVPDSIAPFIESHQAILMERHGSLTVGRTPTEAYLRLEKLEHAAHTLFYARLLNKDAPVPLPQDALQKLMHHFQ
ncbi:MAG: class II aldolase/adducin family protein [Syntrophobacteraceae bacterium]